MSHLFPTTIYIYTHTQLLILCLKNKIRPTNQIVILVLNYILIETITILARYFKY